MPVAQRRGIQEEGAARAGMPGIPSDIKSGVSLYLGFHAQVGESRPGLRYNCVILRIISMLLVFKALRQDEIIGSESSQSRSPGAG